MNTTLYIEPFSGVSGDMFLSALCGLTNSYDEILELPEKLHLEDGRVEILEVEKNGIVCKKVHITDLNEGGHDHSHDDGHSHDHHHHHGHAHRHLSDILKIIDAGRISDGAKEIAKAIFIIIGESESRIHNISIDKIHFHEVSGVDSILDIVGCAVQLDKLGISKTYCDPVCTGFGLVKTQHGQLPVPAPATADILKGIPTFKGNEEGEKTTPTGAAVLKYLAPDFSPPSLTTSQTAYGPGMKDFTNPNVLRISIVEESEAIEHLVIETNIDDASAEWLGSDFQDGLLATGALDLHFTPVQMKKGRPGLVLTALVKAESLDAALDYILEHTPSIGARYYPVKRRELERRSFERATPHGTVQVKEVTRPSGQKTEKIEYESLRQLANSRNISIQTLINRLSKS